MPFLDHLEELRWRIIYILATVLTTAVFGFVIVLRWDIVGELAKPILPSLPNQKLIYRIRATLFRLRSTAR